MGARIGRNARVDSLAIFDHDLIDIAENTFVKSTATLSPSRSVPARASNFLGIVLFYMIVYICTSVSCAHDKLQEWFANI